MTLPGPRLAVGLALAVSAADVLQLALRPLAETPWPRGRWIGCVGGIALYAAIAAGLSRGSRVARAIAVAMPLLPISTLLRAAAGADTGAAPDGAMAAVLALQLSVAAAVALGRAEPPRAS